MRTLYFDCGMGAAGDMLAAALLELLPDAEAFVGKLNQAGIPKVAFSKEASVKCGITGTHLTVTANGTAEDAKLYGKLKGESHTHTSMEEITDLIERLDVSERVKCNIRAVYGKIAQAESTVHGVPVTDVHFHEVGTLDALADVTAVCMLMEELAPERIIVSPVHVGSGSVSCAHGILPVPAPATVELLKGCPIYGGAIDGELCTPSGAALLAHFATEFGNMPLMSVEKIGYGMGKKDFEQANCVRAMLGETTGKENTITELVCNLDDMTAEEMGFAMECLFAEGALEVFTVPCNMKKGRPGQILHVICKPENEEQIVAAIFKYTTTLGIRRSRVERYRLERRIRTVHTEYGPVREKIVNGYGISRFKYEYEDLARIAREEQLPLDEVRRAADNGWEE